MKAYLILAFVAVAGTVNAQEMSRQQMREVRSACEADVRRLCSGIQPGGGKLLQCLQQNASSVSATCTAKLMEIKATRQSK
ncbi:MULTISPECIES: cysteine rich repeat-containing protein [Rhizobium/Agrobacterium group]|uniref:Cysteine rich repeat-containing protein n=2 Tax=Neorhizobium TaxID=1525371 RepID=A0ABV0MB04_9HYPH|nr:MULTISPECIES: cysteine rich repeat-containing protein [Rhizobium/Agrobacterium group]KGD92886.1 hypothetical protein JL39_22325 [Rhizobium sp. YS-1r]MCC2611109.1 cysteine rich repeat-containing protein [Neorhizobium petrolearium]WGI66323.1 cysteine rich repeat-containing protein [Neorhizobium petrolearium]